MKHTIILQAEVDDPNYGKKLHKAISDFADKEKQLIAFYEPNDKGTKLIDELIIKK